jgi:Uma2 family endonuclease
MQTTRIPEELAFPDIDKPYVESVDGRLVAKVSPERRHGRLQLRLGRMLEDWAGNRGEVATEWRFYLLPGDARPSSLVPDVAYVSFERLPLALPEDARDRPRLAPDIAVEIVSPRDRRSVLLRKIDLYLAYGCSVVIVVDPADSTLTWHGREQSETFRAPEIVRVAPYADLKLDLAALFDGI